MTEPLYYRIPLVFGEAVSRAKTRWFIALGVILAALTMPSLVDADDSASAADADLGFPAPPGTHWEVVAGYNTRTHSYSDGNDPHAIDVVRTDGPTEGTVVLAPWDGQLSWFDHSCVTIRNGDFSVLICHLFPDSGLQRGQVVARGQLLGIVAPPFYAGNNGLAHLHIAVHRTHGSGLIQESVPFTGRFALEGKELPATSEPNAYAGVTFTVQTRLDHSDPDFLFPGLNLIAWPSDAGLAAALQPIQDSIRTVFAFSGETQSYQRYSPLGLAALNDLEAIERGAAVWVYVSDPYGVVWDRPALLEKRTITLHPGFNLVTWTGPNTSVQEAIASIEDAVVAIHAFDARSQRYVSYRGGPLASISALTRLTSGQAFWIQVTTEVEWHQA
ncbi:MAG: hypothetical protein OXG19_06485 [Chloroflexi bacterium]|nr:hypothetical protein [Chloroflexota bacterium]